MQLRLVQIDAARWDQALDAAGVGTPFHRAAWIQAWGGRPVIDALVDGSQRVVAGIMRCPRRRMWWTCAGRPAMTAYNGPLILEPQARTKRIELIDQLNAASGRYALEDYILEPGDVDPLPWIWSGFEHQLRLTYVIRAGRVADWRDHLSKHHRRDLRKALREVGQRSTVDVLDDPSSAAATLAQSARQKGFTAPSVEDWRRWRASCAATCGIRCYVQRVDGVAAAAALVVDDGRTAYYLAGGVDRAVGGSSPCAMLLYERAIADALERGLDFNFEGSILRGVEHFFRGWGGDPVPVLRVIRARSVAMRLAWAFRPDARRM